MGVTYFSSNSMISCHSDNKREQPSLPSAIVIGAGFAGIAAARALKNASFQVM